MLNSGRPGAPDYVAWYLGWFDDKKDKPFAEKVQEAKERFIEKFSATPTAVLVNDKDAGEFVEVAGMAVRARDYIRPNHFWVGTD